MKPAISCLAFAAFLAIASMPSPANAQSQELRALCYNKYGLGKNQATASEAQRKESAAKYAACIRSGGKS